MTFRELADQLDAAAGRLEKGGQFKQLWAEHLRVDAKSLRLLAETEDTKAVPA